MLLNERQCVDADTSNLSSTTNAAATNPSKTASGASNNARQNIIGNPDMAAMSGKMVVGNVPSLGSAGLPMPPPAISASLSSTSSTGSQSHFGIPAGGPLGAFGGMKNEASSSSSTSTESDPKAALMLEINAELFK